MENNNTIEKLMQYYNDNPDDFADDIESLDDLNGYLSNDRRHPMDKLDGSLEGYSPTDMLTLAHYSWDEQDSEFNTERKYFYWNRCPGLVSTNNRDYRSDYLSDGTVERIVENATHLHLSEGAQKIIKEQDND